MSYAATPPMMSSKAHAISIWQNGEVESRMGVSHSRVMEEAGFMKNDPVIL